MGLFNRAYWVADTLREHRWREKHFQIAPHELVLDVGSGGSPHFRSNVLCDKFVWDGTERHHQPVVTDRPLVVADVHRLPFRDRAFDFVICSHVLEHVEDPAVAISELARVGRRGYIETPCAHWERVAGFPFHRWLVSVEAGTLLFRGKVGPQEDSEFSLWFETLQDRLRLHRHIWFFRRRAGLYVSVLWADEIPCEVRVEPGTEAEFATAQLDRFPPADDRTPSDLRQGPVSRAIRGYGRTRRRHSQITWAQLVGLLQCPQCGSSSIADADDRVVCAGCGANYRKDAESRPWLLVDQR